MARRITPTTEDMLRLAREATNEMLLLMKQPSRNGSQNLSDTGQWRMRCEQFDLAFFKMINKWVNENADRDERNNGTAGNHITIKPVYGERGPLRREEWGTLKPDGADDQ